MVVAKLTLTSVVTNDENKKQRNNILFDSLLIFK